VSSLKTPKAMPDIIVPHLLARYNLADGLPEL